MLQFNKSLSSSSPGSVPLLLITDAQWPSGGEQGSISEDLANSQAWEGPVLLVSRCGMFSAPALPVAVVTLVHVSASPLGIEVCVRVCVCVCVYSPSPVPQEWCSLLTFLPRLRLCFPNHSNCIASPALLHEGSFLRIHRHLPSL